MIRELLKDPASRTQAAVAGWTHPLTRDGFLTLDLLDLLVQRWAKPGRSFHFPRPSDPAIKRVRAARVSDPARLEKFKVKWREPKPD